MITFFIAYISNSYFKHNHDVWNSFFVLVPLPMLLLLLYASYYTLTTKVAKRENEEKLKNARLDIVKGEAEKNHKIYIKKCAFMCGRG